MCVRIVCLKVVTYVVDGRTRSGGRTTDSWLRSLARSSRGSGSRSVPLLPAGRLAAAAAAAAEGERARREWKLRSAGRLHAYECVCVCVYACVCVANARPRARSRARAPCCLFLCAECAGTAAPVNIRDTAAKRTRVGKRAECTYDVSDRASERSVSSFVQEQRFAIQYDSTRRDVIARDTDRSLLRHTTRAANRHPGEQRDISPFVLAAVRECVARRTQIYDFRLSRAVR